MKNYFCVNVSKYNATYSFEVKRPASLNKPKNNSVMFILDGYVADKADVLKKVNECLIYWPDTIEIPLDISQNNLVIRCNNPHTEYCKFFRDNNIVNIQNKIEFDYVSGAFISKKAIIGENVTIMPGVFIGNDVVVGDNSYIGSGAKIIGEVLIGKNVVIKENAIIGADGLTTDRDVDGSAITMPQFGSVIIEDNVQIGANTVIARGAIDETIIHKGAKIDNLCFISHNVEIGENTFVVGETIMFGSSSTGKNSMISGNSTIRNGIHIGEEALVGMGSVVTKNVSNKTIVKGNPAK